MSRSARGRLGLAFLLFATPAAAQHGGAPHSAPGGAPTLDAALRQDVVDSLAAQLERVYVDADTGRLIARRLRERLAAGAYERLADAGGFAAALADDLRAVNGDLHLGVQYAPGFPAFHPGPAGLPTPRATPPGSVAADEPTPTPAMLAEWRARNFGLERAARLEGNVGYLDVRGFFDGPEAFATADAALGFLERTDAMIFDLRKMPGGSGDMSNWLISHFTGPDTVPSLKIVNRSAGDSVVRWTLAKVTGARRPDIPLFILTSRGTASAGEDFTFVLHNLGRATVVGEPTAGAGHNNAFIDVGHGFVASISYTRVMDPKTGREWERVGIQPDVAVAPDSALDVAHALALQAVAARVSDPARKRELVVTAEVVAARAHPRRLPAALLARYAGTYGERTLTVRDGGLVFRRIPFPPRPLITLSDSTFALESLERVTVENARAGRPRLVLVRSEGDTVRAERTGPVR
jgi:retinol-binding protein 3